MIRTEIEFVLPDGYLDGDGTLHRQGVMRRATAADEIHPLKDPRVKANPAYLTILVLSRVIVQLGSVTEVTPHTVEGLFASDLGYLQDLYNQLHHRTLDEPEPPIPGDAAANGGPNAAANDSPHRSLAPGFDPEVAADGTPFGKAVVVSSATPASN